MSDKPVPSRKVQREHKKSKDVSTLNVRGYRVRGQIFSRILYPEGDRKSLLPPMTEPGESPLDRLPDNIFQGLVQLNISDYTLGPTSTELWRIGSFKGKKPQKEKEKKIGELETGLDGEFAFNNTWLQFDEIYRLVAVLNPRKAPARPERVKVVFCLQKTKVKKMKEEVMDVEAKARHEVLTAPYHSPYNALPKDRGKKRKAEWKQFDEYKLNAKFFQPGAGPGVLWFGGPASILFQTFILDVPYLHQWEDVFPKWDRDKEETPAPFNLNIAFKKAGGVETFLLPVHWKYTCAVTCVTMVLRYFGLKNLKVEDVLKETAIVYLNMNSNKKDYGLPKRNVIELPALKGKYPYCIEGYLTKAGEELIKRHQESIKIQREIYSTSREFDAFSSWAETVGMLGAGWPLIAIKEPEFRPPEGVTFINHACVIRGALIDHKGKLQGIYMNDPWYAPIAELLLDFMFISWTGGQIIIAWALKQKEICPNPERLLCGGEVPAPRRVLHPKASL